MLTENSAKIRSSSHILHYISVLIEIQYSLITELKLKDCKSKTEVMRKYQSTLEAAWSKFQTTDLLHKQESEEHSVPIRASEQN